ncbi:MAG: gamma-glutamyltransferase family protein [Gammaproteobacteria bacterium]|nr:gamma-glutamyltransferase family protein [Gammaproteobacteria bacterium]
MLQTIRARRGMVSSSHHLAAESGLRILREGGNAVEAMVSAAATISVVYPHMNGLGGDGFWLISEPGRRVPIAINAIGAAAARATADTYRAAGHETIPVRGALAANTVAGTVSGWQRALALSEAWGGRMPLERLLEDAIHHAETGFPVSDSQHANTLAKRAELGDVPGWADTFLHDGEVPAPGALFKQPALAGTLKRLASAGLDDFYRGGLARRIDADLARIDSLVTGDDYARQRAVVSEPLSVRLRGASVYNVTPPSQGLASLIILALFDRMRCEQAESFAHVHGVVEATKQAILVRNARVTDPAYMDVDPAQLLDDAALDELAARIDPRRALPWGPPSARGDTVWLGAVDSEGRAVSFIHSIYWEFGSGVVLRDTGIQCQNRGSSFSLDPQAQNHLLPGRLPFHTNNPALALLDDGRVLVYGAMGGDGQPQTQAALFTRYAMFDSGLQEAVTAPRWVLSRTWGEERSDLRMERRFDDALVGALEAAGHAVTLVDEFDEVMGHAGAIALHPSGLIEGATDPRSCGAVAAY